MAKNTPPTATETTTPVVEEKPTLPTPPPVEKKPAFTVTERFVEGKDAIKNQPVTLLRSAVVGLSEDPDSRTTLLHTTGGTFHLIGAPESYRKALGW
jgi:hypothetical protein